MTCRAMLVAFSLVWSCFLACGAQGGSPTTPEGVQAEQNRTGAELNETAARPGKSSVSLATSEDAAQVHFSSDVLDQSHAKMVKQLAAIKSEAAKSNTFLGYNPIPELKNRLIQLPSDASPLRWRTLRDLASHQLRVGETGAAVQHLEEAVSMLPSLSGEMPPQAAIGTVLAAAVAQLRLGEVQNCRVQHNADSCILPIQGKGVHRNPEGSQAALKHLKLVLEHTGSNTPEHLTARWLYNIAFMTLGQYPQGVPEAYRIPLHVYGDDVSVPRFRNVAASLGVDAVDLAGGSVVDDLNGDGYLDWLTSTSDTAGGMRLFLGQPNGKFKDATASAGLEGLYGGLNLTAADYDNDGDLDVYVLRGAWWDVEGRHPNSLLINDGNAYFRDGAYAAGIAEPAYPTQTAAWADIDRDGDLDLYVGNESTPTLQAPSQLFLNLGNGKFKDVAAEAGVTNDRFAKAVAFGDFDNDLDPDLFVSNQNGINRLYENLGDTDQDRIPEFEDIAKAAGVETPIASFPSWFWDFNQDGHLDLFVAAYGGRQTPPDVWTVSAGYLGQPNPGEAAVIYLGNGKGSFKPLPPKGPLARPTLPMGANFADVDNDGYPDVYLGTGYPRYEGLMPNELWKNQEGETVAQSTISSGLGHLQKGHAVSFADFDRDGDLDIFEQLGGAYPGDAFGNALFINPADQNFKNQWIKIKLVGVQSPRDAQGTKVIVTAKYPSGLKKWTQTVGGGGSFGVSPISELHFGLGAAESIESIEVRWTSGVEDRLDDPGLLQIGEIIKISEKTILKQ